MILGAIDIGSNACRMLICDAHPYKDGSVDFTKLNLLRIPLRLGFDVFRFGKISVEKRQMIIDSMIAYKQLEKIYKVEHLVVCATSAMRDAANSREIIHAVKEYSGIDITIISGSQEAAILNDAHFSTISDNEAPSVYVDVGGGSTEITTFVHNELKYKRSFNLGTIRILLDNIQEQEWMEMKQYLKDITKELKNFKVIGTGGNINKVFSLSKTKEGKSLSAELLKDYYREFAACTVEDRMHLYKLREDRADVIVPALQIYTSALKWVGATEIFVPKIGLADGLIKNLYAAKRSQPVT